MRTRTHLLLASAACVLLTCSLVQAAEPPLGGLIQDLAGPDARARAVARQLLPRQGPAAVTDLIPLLTHADPMVAAAAFSVLLEIGNEVSVPGKDVERRRMTDQLIALVKPDRPQNERIIGLRLLERLVPAGYNVSPVAAMLKAEPLLRDKARTALQRMATPEARAALRSALDGAEPDFQCALLNSLGELEDAGSLDAIKALTQSQRPGVRAAAARALAWTGDPVHLACVKQIIASADEPTRSDANDALLRLLNAIEAKGGNWQIVSDSYLALLKTGEGVLKDAALAGLGRIGDGTCVTPVLEAIRDADVRTLLSGISTLRQAQGVDVTRELVRAWPQLPPKTQLALLPALGEKQSPLTLAILREAAESNDPATRLAGLEALGKTGLAEALAALSIAARKGTDPEKTAAVEGTLAIADVLRQHNDKDRAGNAYLTALKCALDKPARARALEALVACPVPAAFDDVIQAADDNDIKEPAIRALLGLAARLGPDQRDRAMKAYDKVRELGPSPEQLQALAAQMKQLGVEVDLGAMFGVVTRWHLVGPFELGENNKNFSADLVNEASVDLNATYQAGDRQLAWKPVTTTDVHGIVDLLKTVAPADHCLAYACARIDVPTQTKAVLKMGGDDGLRVWVNGQLVHDHLLDRALTVDQDQAPVTLQAGVNTILVKISQSVGGWSFCLRVTTPDGKPLGFTQQTK